MKGPSRYGILAPLLGILVASISLLVLGPGARGLVCEPSWSTVAGGDQLKKPRALATISSDDIWVVGSTSKNGAPMKTGAEHWNGSGWSLYPTPDVGSGENALSGVDASAAEDVWAVGYSQAGGRYKTLVEHWDGSQWRVVASPNAGNGDNTLVGVDVLGSTDAWAVGSYRTATSRKSLIQRWDGVSWTTVRSPDPGSLGNSLLGVSAAGPNDVWAVGWRNGGDGLRSLLLHFDGTRWTQAAAVPEAGTGDNVLTGISAVSSDDIWATGYYVDDTRHETLTLHYDGTAWSRVPSPNGADGTSILLGTDAVSHGDAWAAGFEFRAEPQRYVASTQRWDGSGWTAFPSAASTDGTRESAMFDVARAPDTSQAWAVGRSGTRLTTGGVTGIVETICPSGGNAATASRQVESKGVPARGPASRSAKRPDPMPTGTLGPVTPAATTKGMPVRAIDRAAEAGISENTRTYGAIVADFDGDTSPDIFLDRHGSSPRLYENAGNGRFQETNQGAFLRSDRHGCDAADVDGDGLVDIFCTEGASNGTAPKRNELYVQRQDNTFAERAAQYGVFDPFGRGRAAELFDATGDGRPDLFVGNDPTRVDGLPSPNRFYTNQSGVTFRPAPEGGLDREEDLQGGYSDVGDLDKDGWKDLLLNTSRGLRVYHNEQGMGFAQVAASVGLGQSPQDVTLADVNGDGWSDVVEVEPGRLSVFINTNGTFSQQFSTTLRYGFSVAAGDVNGDDRPDLYVMRGRNGSGTNAPDQVYLNDGTGSSFTRMSSIPSTSQGEADSVAPLDHDGNGLTDFLVLNGGGEEGSLAGPVQLIAFFRSH